MVKGLLIMNNLKQDIEKFIELAKLKEPDLDKNTLMQIANNIIFLKNFGNSLKQTHYLDSLIQDSLSIIDSFSHKSERYYYFILRSFIENFLRVLLNLEDNDSTGIMKLFRSSKKTLEKFESAFEIFENIETQYDRCCLFVHSNIKANTEISIYFSKILERNDFNDINKINSTLKQFGFLLEDIIKILIIRHYETIDSSFYRNKVLLRQILSNENYTNFRLKISEE